MDGRSWKDVTEEQLNPLIKRRMVHTRRMTIARLELSKGAIVPLHHHPNEQVTVMESGTLVFRMGGQEIAVSAGQLLEIPPDLPHEVEALEDSVTTDLFSPPREDWIRGDDAYLRK